MIRRSSSSIAHGVEQGGRERAEDERDQERRPQEPPDGDAARAGHDELQLARQAEQAQNAAEQEREGERHVEQQRHVHGREAQPEHRVEAALVAETAEHVDVV